MRSSRILRSALAAAALIVAPSLFAAGDAMSIVPLDATVVGSVHVSDMRTSPLSGKLFFGSSDTSIDDEAARFLAEAGIDPKQDVDTLVFSLAPNGDEPKARVLVACDGRFDPARLSAAIVSRGGVAKSYAGSTYIVAPEASEPVAVAFVDSHLALAGHEAAVRKALDDRAAGGSSFFARSGLGREYGRIDHNATSWLLVDVPRSARYQSTPVWNGGATGEAATASAALKKVSVIGLWAVDSGDSMKLGATALSYDEETRDLLEDTLRGMLSAWRLAVQDKSPDLVPVLRAFEVSQSSDAVSMRGTVPAALITEWQAKVAAQKSAATR